METQLKADILIYHLTRIDRAIMASMAMGNVERCPECRCYRFDPLFNREEAAAYTGFSKGSLATFDCTKRYNLHPVKFDNAVRYHLSSLNRFVDDHMRPW